MSVQHNAHAVAVSLAGMGPRVRDALVIEVSRQAQLVARRMRENAPKFISQLTNSIRVDNEGPLRQVVRPGVDYAEAVEGGVKPGGRGLPRFFDPKSAPMQQWLAAKAFAGTRRVRKGTGRFTLRELELRDRYEGLAHHIRVRGVKAQPFVKPTGEQMREPVQSALIGAVQRALQS
jgi:hypothetical protein